VLVGGVVPIVVTWHFGALGIPRNDDWSYALAAFRLADSGELNGNNWVGVHLVGQLVLSLPIGWLFGDRIAALQIAVATIGVFGLIAVFDLGKQLGSRQRGLFVALMVAVGPMWANLSVSYMTDVPALALAMICLALGARAVQANVVRLGLFCTAVLIGFAAFTVREIAIVAPLSVCLTALWTAGRWSRPRRVPILAVLAGFVVIAAIFVMWRRDLPGFQTLTARFPKHLAEVPAAWRRGVGSAVLVGLLVSPAVLLAGPRRLVSAAWARGPRASVAAGLVTVVVLGGETAQHRASGMFLGPGNFVLPNGIVGTDTLAGTRPDLLPRPLFAALALVGVLAVVLLVLAAVPPTMDAFARIRDGRLGTPASPALAVVTLGAAGYGLAFLLPAAFGLPLYDRYMLPFVALVGLLALARGPAVATPRGTLIVSGAALLALAAFGFIYAANSASFDGTKWSVAEQATTLAGSPDRVGGGFEWVNYQAGTYISQGNYEGRFCIVLRAERNPFKHSPPLLAAGVWGPRRTQVWIVARQTRPC
jgi:hypothetical protein